jgi:hypothetical protein
MNIFDQMRVEGKEDEIRVCSCGKEFWKYWKNPETDSDGGVRPVQTPMTQCGPCYFKSHKT